MDNELQMLLDEKACEKLIAEYCRLADFGNASGIADLFVADGSWAGPGVSMIGQDAIREGFSRREAVTRRQSRHICTNVLIHVDGDQAHGLCYIVHLRHDSLPATAESSAP